MKFLFVLLGLIVGICTWGVTQVPLSVYSICIGVFILSTVVMLLAMVNAEEFPYDGRM